MRAPVPAYSQCAAAAGDTRLPALATALFPRRDCTAWVACRFGSRRPRRIHAPPSLRPLRLSLPPSIGRCLPPSATRSAQSFALTITLVATGITNRARSTSTVRFTTGPLFESVRHATPATIPGHHTSTPTLPSLTVWLPNVNGGDACGEGCADWFRGRDGSDTVAVVVSLGSPGRSPRRLRFPSGFLAAAPAVARDPRWGRQVETYSEDPWMCGQLGAAIVRGTQWGLDGGASGAGYLKVRPVLGTERTADGAKTRASVTEWLRVMEPTGSHQCARAQPVVWRKYAIYSGDWALSSATHSPLSDSAGDRRSEARNRVPGATGGQRCKGRTRRTPL